MGSRWDELEEGTGPVVMTDHFRITFNEAGYNVARGKMHSTNDGWTCRDGRYPYHLQLRWATR